jgi:hypothetical protein
MIVTMLSCPNCHSLFEMRMLACSSGLGPSEIDCLRCGKPIQTDRTEWADMSTGQRIWFFAMTLIYVVMLGEITGNFVDGSWQLWNLEPDIVNLDYGSRVFQVAAGVGGVMALSLQIARVTMSNRRLLADRKLSVREFVFGLQWNLQFKCLLLLIAVWVIAKLKYSLAMP